MLTLLSPAKTLDEHALVPDVYTMPRLLEETDKLAQLLKKKKPEQLKSLMKISDKLAQLNYERFQNFTMPFSLENAKQAMFMFKGDVYVGLEAAKMNEQEIDFAQGHLRILSGFYGLLRPLDLMFPYRLEMGTKLSVRKKKNLYEFWGDKIVDLVNEDLEASGSKILVNLASQEYFKSINTKKIAGQLVNVHFKENRNGIYKVISFNAKKARGAMANQIIKYRIQDEEGLKSLLVNNYIYNEEMSKQGELVFTTD